MSFGFMQGSSERINAVNPKRYGNKKAKRCMSLLLHIHPKRDNTVNPTANDLLQKNQKQSRSFGIVIHSIKNQRF